MNILERGEIFEAVDGQYGYTHTVVVYESDGHVYHARSMARLLELANLKAEDLTDVIEIPVNAYRPLMQSGITALATPPMDCHIKRPRLSSYDDYKDSANPDKIADDLLIEVNVCETLRLHPHPNIAQYLGCEVRDGRISGLCFARYDQTLKAKVNPGHRMKRALKVSTQALDDCGQFLEDVEKGIRHLHSLGLVHNDINPANIMFDQDNTPIVIDFGSCRAAGHSLEKVGRTYEWYDEDVQTSRPENDLDALCEIQEMLSNKDIRDFRFKE